MLIDGSNLDPETLVRLKCLDAVEAAADRAAHVGVFTMLNPTDIANGVNLLYHEMTNGEGVAFECSDSLRKTVRGG